MAMSPLRQATLTLQTALPWSRFPLIVQAPMKVLAGPKLAVSSSGAGGLGFLGPGEKPEHLLDELKTSRELIAQSSPLKHYLEGVSPILPVGFGIQTWTSDLETTCSILRQVADSYPPCAAWLFAPRNGQTELDEWTQNIRKASPSTKIWIQVASVVDALAASRSHHAPDVLVIQGADAGGHSRTKGAGLIALVPEVADMLEKHGLSYIPLIAAGGIADARGTAAAMTLGATGVAMGTRFLVTPEARINKGYQKAILDGSDGGQSTVRTQLYNHLRGTFGWPEEYDARGLVNASWRDHEAGMAFEQNKTLHAEALQKGSEAWGETNGRTATYAGTNIGLINEVKTPEQIITETRECAEEIVKSALDNLEGS